MRQDYGRNDIQEPARLLCNPVKSAQVNDNNELCCHKLAPQRRWRGNCTHPKLEVFLRARRRELQAGLDWPVSLLLEIRCRYTGDDHDLAVAPPHSPKLP
jgi:hypothetical protein